MNWLARALGVLLIFLFVPGVVFAATSSAQAKKTKFLSCVPYARSVSGIMLRGDAHTWWKAAENRYLRTQRPVKGSVMVMAKTPRLPRGHLALVSSVLSDREVLLDHANWLNKGQIHKNMLAVDVSSENDWSVVRVWYQPNKTLGWHNYKVSGFILPESESMVASVVPSQTAIPSEERESEVEQKSTIENKNNDTPQESISGATAISWPSQIFNAGRE